MLVNGSMQKLFVPLLNLRTLWGVNAELAVLQNVSTCVYMLWADGPSRFCLGAGSGGQGSAVWRTQV